MRRACAKAVAAGASAEFHEGFLTRNFLAERGAFDVVTSSLVFHRIPLTGTRDLVSMMRLALRPAGKLFIADYSLQRTSLMRCLFRATVQSLDGVDDTQPNADGVLPEFIKKAGFADAQEVRVIPTATGSISILSARTEKTVADHCR